MLDIAMVHIAIHDAVQAYQHRYKTYNAPIPGAAGSTCRRRGQGGARRAGESLPGAGPEPGPDRAGRYRLHQLPDEQGLAVNDPGVAVGEQAALNIILNRANDGSFPANPEIFTGSTGARRMAPDAARIRTDGGAVDGQRHAVRAEGHRRSAERAGPADI